MKRFGKIILVALLFVLLSLNATAATVEGVLAQRQPPEGVVFEIIEGDR